jgi:hypothetical protein
VIFGIADIEAPVKAAGIEFCLIGENDYSPGTLNPYPAAEHWKSLIKVDWGRV